jgi:hypothetical protein
MDPDVAARRIRPPSRGGARSPLAVAEDDRREARLHRQQDRAARLFAGMTDAIERATDARGLLADACRVVADGCCLDLAFIGLACRGGTVRTAARAGGDRGGRDALVLAATAGADEESPTSRVLRTGRAVVHQDALDLPREPSDARWRAAARAQGLRWIAAFPLSLRGKVVGAFTLCSSQACFFDVDAIATFGRIALRLSGTLERLAIGDCAPSPA